MAFSYFTKFVRFSLKFLRRCNVGALGRRWLTIVILALISGTANAGLADGRIEFGLISPRDPEQMRANWQPFADRMEKAIGVRVVLRAYENHKDLVQDFLQARVDIAWVGNVPALEIVEKGAGSVFAQMVTKEGSFGYRSALLVSEKSPLKDIQSVIENAGKLKFGDGDPKSTSGFLVPLYFAFQKNGVSDTKKIFASVRVGSHQENIRRVVSGEVDVATANNEELGFFVDDKKSIGAGFRVIWESPLIPQSPLVWHNSLPSTFKKKVAAFVSGFGANADEKEILLKMNGLSRFRPSSNLQLVPIADLEMFKARQAIAINDRLTPEQRREEIDLVIKRSSIVEMRLKLNPF